MPYLLFIAQKNIRHWRWRIFGIAALVALTLCLQVFYASYLEYEKRTFLDTVQPLDLPFDLLVVVEPRGRIMREDELPPLPVMSSNRRDTIDMIALMEPALYISAESAGGTLSVLGAAVDSMFINPTRIAYKGQWLTSAGEIMLSQEVADREGLMSGSNINLVGIGNAKQWYCHHLSLRLVGTYTGSELPQAMILYEDAVTLSGMTQPNACMFNHPRNTITREPMRTVTPARLQEWLQPVYPKARFISASTPEIRSADLLESVYRPGYGLYMQVSLFAFVAITTIAMMTYLDRRGEYASLKSQGSNRRQMITMFSLEYGLAGVLGLSMGFIGISFLSRYIIWFADAESIAMIKISLFAGIITMLIMMLALIYPVGTSIAATVNQLLYSRKVALRHLSIDHLQRPNNELISREREERLRLLKLPALEGEENDILLMKRVGDRVKTGETIALQERFMGFIVFEWKAICDGEVMFMDSGGLIGIRPDDPDQPFYPYTQFRLRHQG